MNRAFSSGVPTLTRMYSGRSNASSCLTRTPPSFKFWHNRAPSPTLTNRKFASDGRKNRPSADSRADSQSRPLLFRATVPARWSRIAKGGKGSNLREAACVEALALSIQAPCERLRRDGIADP